MKFRIHQLHLKEPGSKNQDLSLQILQLMPQVVFYMDMNERIYFISNHCYEVFQYDANEILLKDIVHIENLLSVREFLRNIRRNQVNTNLNISLTDRNNNTIPVLFSASYVFNDEMKGFICTAADNKSQANTIEHLEAANNAKSKFLSIIAHDLKSPFNSIVGFSNLLLNQCDLSNTVKTKEYVRYISESSQNAHDLLENLLEWARAHSGRINYQPNMFSLHMIVFEILALLTNTAHKKNIHINVFGIQNLMVFADKNMVRTILRNLLSNAIKYSHKGSGIEIRGFETENNASITVKDSGIGISEERISKLFQMDEIISMPGTEKEGGTGLGLLLTHEFALINRGDIKVNSKIGEGSEFTLTLPKFMTP